MKAKYLFYSLALASAFTACTQDELFDAPALESNMVADRPVAGVVTFVNDDVESRYDRQNADFETGDEMGLYLMDEFRGSYEGTVGELANANLTYWDWQSSWWTMYNMVDYIQTNYGYVHNADTKEWINRASQLVEGNYIALFPQNKRATNRRDLWHPIKGNVDLVDHTSTPRYYVNRDNQFFVGYEQIKRDQKAGEETGELRADITMKPIMTYLKMFFENTAANKFKIQKVVFKAPGGNTLPNVAYIKPADIVSTDNEGCVGPFWAWGNHAELKKQFKDECGNVLAWSKYDRKTYNQDAAREIVQYASTVDGQIPYGMTEAEALPVYEYVFNFPKDADILMGHDGSNDSSERVCGISIALPAFEGWKNMEVVVYGEMWDPTINFPEGGYRPGIIRKLKNVDNAEFKLDQLNIWKQGYDIPTVTAKIDDNYFYQQNEIRVATTKDLYDLLYARLSNATTTENIYFQVQHYGNGLEITDEVVELLRNYRKVHNDIDVTVEFNNADNVDTPLIFKAEDAIDEFEYVNVNVVVEAPQTITDVTVDGILDLNNFSTITIVENAATAAQTKLQALDVTNEIGGTMIVNGATIAGGEIHNEGTLTLKDATINGLVKNEAVMTSEGTTNVTSIINYNNCINCGKDDAVLTVKAGTLNVASTLENSDIVNVELGAVLNAEYLTNYGTMNVNGTVNVLAEGTNKGTVNITATGFVRVIDKAVLKNYNKAVIKVEGQLAEQIKNSGEIFVINNGQVITNGIVDANGIIDVTEATGDANDAQKAMDYQVGNKGSHFRYIVKTSTTAAQLKEALTARISNRNINDSFITIVYDAKDEITYVGRFDSKIDVLHVVVEKGTTLIFTKSETEATTSFLTLSNTCGVLPGYKAFEVKEGAKVIVSDGATLTLNKDNEVWVNGIFNANDNSTLSGRAKVYGAGEFWMSTKRYDWTVGSFTGKKYGWN